MIPIVTIKEPLVSVIIPTYNAKRIISECLDAVLKLDYSNFEILVVDDCSCDATFDFVNKHYPDIKIIQTKKNSGFAASVNMGVRNSNGEIIALLNMDTVVRPGWLKPMTTKLTGDASIGLVGSKILFPDGKTIQHAGGVLRKNGLAFHIGRGYIDKGQFDKVREVDYVCGASLGIKRILLNKIGLLDEFYKPLYYEDTDLAYRVKKAGKKVVYLPDSVLIHTENISTHGLSRRFYYFFHTNRLKFVLKNYSFKNIVPEFFKEEKKWFSEEMPVHIKTILFRVYFLVFLILPWLIFRRVIVSILYQKQESNA